MNVRASAMMQGDACVALLQVDGDDLWSRAGRRGLEAPSGGCSGDVPLRRSLTVANGRRRELEVTSEPKREDLGHGRHTGSAC